jgi:hypothetical protein
VTITSAVISLLAIAAQIVNRYFLQFEADKKVARDFDFT